MAQVMMLEIQWDLQLGIGRWTFFDLNFRVAIDEMLPNKEGWARVLLKVVVLIASSSCLQGQEKDKGFVHTRWHCVEVEMSEILHVVAVSIISYN